MIGRDNDDELMFIIVHSITSVELVAFRINDKSKVLIDKINIR